MARKKLPVRNSQRSAKSTAPKSAVRPLPEFPIVGVGVPVGGLEALEDFLRHLPPASGMACVIATHLEAPQSRRLPERLRRATSMKVVPVRDRTKVRPDCVYLLPPNRALAMSRGEFRLTTPAGSGRAHPPIDSFFRSLARDQQEASIGVLLSGRESDGTAGLRAIKDCGGLVLVQDPKSATQEGTPRNASAAGSADVVASPKRLPGKLLAACRRRRPVHRGDETEREGVVRGVLTKVVLLLRAKTGHDFSLYRRSTIARRVERRMAIHRLHRTADYLRHLQDNAAEGELLFKELLIGVTSFFRDPAAWTALQEGALTALIASAAADGGRTLRAWVPGCSTGEEAYSLAILFKETLARLPAGEHCTLQVYATDLDRDAISRARQGVFPESIATDVSAERLARFFVKEEHGYRVKKEIRETVVFATQNLIMDPPFTKLDLLCCRNLLIYLTPELQRKVFPVFHYSLRPGGVLFLGSAESIGGFTSLFAVLSGKDRIFRRLEAVGRAVPVEFPARSLAAEPGGVAGAGLPSAVGESLSALAEQLLLKQHLPPAVLVNADGDILFVSGRTGRYLEPAAGKANWNIVVMARDELRSELTGALHQALRERTTIVRRGLKIRTEAGEQGVNVTVQPLESPESVRGMALIVFAEGAVAPAEPQIRGGKGKAASGEQMRELQRSHDALLTELQACREEKQSSQEELRSMNEELQSANEELQSSNEELMTSKEEMQSLNDDLQTVITVLESKLDELSGANNDMKNLLNSTDLATVFLDEQLRVRRFTSQANRLFKFIPGDVGRPITDLATELCYPTLAADAHEVLRTLMFSEKAIATRDGGWFNTRIMPYRTIENRIDGVVITFSDISAAKRLETELREKCLQLEALAPPSAAKRNPVRE